MLVCRIERAKGHIQNRESFSQKILISAIKLNAMLQHFLAYLLSLKINLKLL